MMDAKQMLRQCGIALKQLEQLEGHINDIPKKDAAKFVFQSTQDVKELMHIARLETSHNVTPEQAVHITKIVNRATAFIHALPEDVRKELGGEKDSV
jgi:hypothetical protein